MHYNDRASPVAQAPTSKKTLGVVTTFKQRDAWSRKIALNPLVKLTHRNVLQQLALCMRVIGKDDKRKDMVGKVVCNPTHVALAKASQCSRNTARRALDVAEEIGVVRKARASDGRVASELELMLPIVVAAQAKKRVFNGAKAAVVSGSNLPKFEVSTYPNLDTEPEFQPAQVEWAGQEAKRKEEEGRKKASKSGPSGPQAALVETQHLCLTPLTAADDAALNLALEADIPDNKSAPERRLCSGRVDEKEQTGTHPLNAPCCPICLPVANAAGGTLIELAGHAARRPETQPHNKGGTTMAIPKPEPREVMFARLLRWYPPEFIGGDDQLNREAFEICLDHGVTMQQLQTEAILQFSEACDGRDVPALAEWLVAQCWDERIAA